MLADCSCMRVGECDAACGAGGVWKGGSDERGDACALIAARDGEEVEKDGPRGGVKGGVAVVAAVEVKSGCGAGGCVILAWKIACVAVVVASQLLFPPMLLSVACGDACAGCGRTTSITAALIRGGERERLEEGERKRADPPTRATNAKG